MMEWNEFREILLKNVSFNQDDLNLIEKAFYFAKEVHKNQTRKNGEPYFNHCLRTALNLLELKLGKEFIISALLHDVLEDCNASEEIIKKEFGEEILFLIKGVTKIGHYKYYQEDEEQAENLRNFILAFTKDIRVAIIKLADRLDNIRTLQYLPLEKQKRIALETRDVFIPLAIKLGFYNWATEMEEICFKVLEPEKYEYVVNLFKEKIEPNKEKLEIIKKTVLEELENNGIRVVEVSHRIKSYVSIYKKLRRKDFDPEKIYDIFGIRVIVQTIEECYLTLGIIHSLYLPLEAEFDDYIAKPKPNGYRSLHTVVLTDQEIFVEFQIRTQEMHIINEFGTAAYFAYNQFKLTKSYQKGSVVFAKEEETKLTQELRSFYKNQNFTDFLNLDFLKDKIYVFTPKRKIIELPAGSTPIDFAYKIHTEIGNHCAGVKVNGNFVSLDYELKNGDIVEIIADKNKKPSLDWLNFVKTSKAKKKIISFLKNINQPKENGDVILKITGIDKPGVLNSILEIFKKQNINIKEHKGLTKNNRFILQLKFTANQSDVKKIVELIKNRVNGIFEIKINKL